MVNGIILVDAGLRNNVGWKRILRNWDASKATLFVEGTGIVVAVVGRRILTAGCVCVWMLVDRFSASKIDSKIVEESIFDNGARFIIDGICVGGSENRGVVWAAVRFEVELAWLNNVAGG